MRSGWSLALALPVVLLAASCEENVPVDPPSAPADPVPTERAEATEPTEPQIPTEAPSRPSEAAHQMHDRYDAVLAMRSALVAGELEAAKALARTIGPVTAELPERAQASRGVVPERAQTLVAAADVAAGGRAFGALLEGCGSCHARAHVALTFETPPVPSGDSAASHMRRHEWAVDRMWEALLSADPERFDRGAAALAEDPLVREGSGESVAAIAARVHARASESAEARSMSERAALFGDIVASCSACHHHFEELERLGIE